MGGKDLVDHKQSTQAPHKAYWNLAIGQAQEDVSQTPKLKMKIIETIYKSDLV